MEAKKPSQGIKRALAGMEMLDTLLNHALRESKRMSASGMSLEEAREHGFSSKQHCLDLGLDPQEVYNLTEDVLRVVNATRKSLGIHLGVQANPENLPSVISVPMSRDAFHLVLFAITGELAAAQGNIVVAVDCKFKFAAYLDAIDGSELQPFIDTLAKLHHTICPETHNG